MFVFGLSFDLSFVVALLMFGGGDDFFAAVNKDHASQHDMFAQSPTNVSWPPQGLHLEIHFTAPSTAPPQHQTIDLAIHYEMYTG